MRAILDTPVFLWWNIDDPRLSDAARELIADGGNEIYLSAASAWEIAIKAGRGSLVLPEPPDEYVPSRLQLHRFQALPVSLSHALRVYQLPDIQRDPFDRLLVAQSQVEDWPVLTADADISRYGITVIW